MRTLESLTTEILSLAHTRAAENQSDPEVEIEEIVWEFDDAGKFDHLNEDKFAVMEHCKAELG